MERRISGVSGDGGLGFAGAIGVMEISGSATTRLSVASTSSGGSPGKIRQFTVARARCGNAFSACPPSSMVATQVVRRRALYPGVAASRRTEAASGGFLRTPRMAAPTSGSSSWAVRWKNACVTSLSFSGKSNAATRDKAAANW